MTTRQIAISDAKNSSVARSTTPFISSPKWVRKLNEATVSTTKGGAQGRNAARTRSTPLMRNRKRTASPTTNAITWFLVRAETQAPIAMKAPAIAQLPR